MNDDITVSEFRDTEIFARGLHLWFEAGASTGTAFYEDLKLEQMGKHVGHVAIIEWIDRDTARYVMQGGNLISLNNLDPTGLDLFNMVHDNNLEKVKDFDEAVIMKHLAGLSTFSVHVDSGLSFRRKMAVFPLVSRRSEQSYLFVCTEPLPASSVEASRDVLQYCQSHFSRALFAPADLRP